MCWGFGFDECVGDLDVDVSVLGLGIDGSVCSVWISVDLLGI